jgi:hypothetical protein
MSNPVRDCRDQLGDIVAILSAEQLTAKLPEKFKGAVANHLRAAAHQVRAARSALEQLEAV